MKKKSIFISGLLIISISLCSFAPAQKPGAQNPGKKPQVGQVGLTRQITVQPVSRPASVMGDIKVFVDGVNGAVINWETTYELGNLGFNIYRVDSDGMQRPVNDSLIGGSMMRVSERVELTGGQAYSAYDPAGRSDSSWYIETVDKRGQKALYGPVAPSYERNIKTKAGYNERLRPDFTGENSGLVLQKYPASLKSSFKTPRPPGSSSGEVFPSDPINQKWVAAQPGVKIRVSKNGIYHITKAQLQAAGFNIAASPANWQLYLNGIEQKMIVEPAGNFIEFYGRGIDIQNSDFQMYYLIAGAGPGQRMLETIRRAFAPPVESRNFSSVTHYEPRSSFVSGQIVNGDLDNWFGPIVSSGTVSRTISVKDIDPDGADVSIKVAAHGFTSTHHRFQVKMNGSLLGEIVYVGIVPASKTFSTKASLVPEGNNTFEFTAVDAPGDVSLLDFVEITYDRLYKADQNTLTFDTRHLHNTRVAGFNTANIRVFDLYYENDPMLILNTTVTPGVSGFDVAIPSGRAHPMIAVNENSVLSPVSITLNTPSTLSSTTSTADMLILSHGNFMTESNNWANYRRGQGLTVDVVNVEDVYDEFDFGLPTPSAVKAYLLYLKGVDANLKYVMLAGDSTYDSRNYMGLGYNDFIPTKFIDTSEGESPSDEFLGDANGDGVAEMAIGRMTVRDGATMTFMQTKVTAFEASVADALLTRGALFVADQPDGWDFDYMNHQLRNELPAAMPATFVYALENPPFNATDIRTKIINGVNAGPFLVNYAGHGAPRVWSSLQIMRYTPNAPATNDVINFTNSGSNLSIFLMLTCLNGFFADLSDDSIAEGVMKLPTGGSPTTWASTGSTTPNIQEEMALVFFDLLGQGTYTRLGDATHAAKLNATSPEVPLTWAIIGDPSLKIK